MSIKLYEEFWPFNKNDKDKNMDRLKSIPKLIIPCIKESTTGFRFNKIDVGMSKSNNSKFIIDMFNNKLNFKVRMVFKLDVDTNRLSKLESYYLTSDNKVKIHSVRKSGTDSYNKEFAKLELLKNEITNCLTQKGILN